MGAFVPYTTWCDVGFVADKVTLVKVNLTVCTQ
jgi:hypothetical protein